jgi:hypothetical protein
VKGSYEFSLRPSNSTYLYGYFFVSEQNIFWNRNLTQQSDWETYLRMQHLHVCLPFLLTAFGDVEEDEPSTRPVSTLSEPDLLHADWLQELPEDLDVLIAERSFESAVDLVEKG